MELKIVSYNVCSLEKNINIVRELCNEEYDLILLQETFLMEHKLGFLDGIHVDYSSYGVGAILSDQSLTAMAGRPMGGLACLWRKSSTLSIEKVFYESFFLAIVFRIGNFVTIVVNVYVKSITWDVCSLEEYLSALSTFEQIINDYSYDTLIFGGDFNCDPFVPRTWNILSNFLDDNDLKCLDVESLNRDSFTFTGYGNSHIKWLDHFIGRLHQSVLFTDFNILYDHIGSDHLPLEMKLTLDPNVSMCSSFSTTSHSSSKSSKLNWCNIKKKTFDKINLNVNDTLKRLDRFECVDCSSIGCRSERHLYQIDQHYNALIKSVQDASREFKKPIVKKFKQVPGWNRSVKEHHSNARNAYLAWIADNKLRSSPSFCEMVRTRKIFKNALKQCKLDRNAEIAHTIESEYAQKDAKSFWRDVKCKKDCNKRPNIVDGELNDSNIINVFSNKFLLYGDETINENTELEEQFIKSLKIKWRSERKMHLCISAITLEKLIKKLKIGIGHDGIHTLFLRNASDDFLIYLSSFFNACLRHCYFPSELLKGDIVPTIKDRGANVTESSNFRPVMKSSILLKLIEHHILEILKEKVHFDPRQFGFGKGLSTDDACFVAKEIIFEHTKKGGYIAAAFVDLSNAFSNVNHFKLGQILLRRGIPPDIALILLHYLRNQTARITWNNKFGCYHLIEKGVRQGGVLSAFLFKLYMDDLVKQVSSAKIGANFGIQNINILTYADDILLLSPTFQQLSIIYGILCNQLELLGLKINCKKTKCILFGNERRSALPVPSMLNMGNHDLEIVKSIKYLGYFLKSDLTDTDDIKKRLFSFYSKFFTLFKDFNNLKINTFVRLFNSYVKPDFGLALWSSSCTLKNRMFKTFEVAFSNALKRILGLSKYSSSHTAALYCNQLLFRHHVALTQARFAKRIVTSQCSLVKLNMPFCKNGFTLPAICSRLSKIYNIKFSNCGIDTIRARIEWIQNHENGQ